MASGSPASIRSSSASTTSRPITRRPSAGWSRPGAGRWRRDYAEALILGCTLEIGFYREIEKALGVPVIDPSIAALKRAEYAAQLNRQCGWVPSRMWSCEPPPEEEIAALRPASTRAEAFGQRLVVEAE